MTDVSPLVVGEPESPKRFSSKPKSMEEALIYDRS
jgi:hypothetical protein